MVVLEGCRLLHMVCPTRVDSSVVCTNKTPVKACA